MTTAASAESTFGELGLAAPVLKALENVGYENPTPIQARTIPPLLAGRDVLGQAQTGTGKTAAFALPLLSRIDPDLRQPQVLVLAPTRELAIQVAEAFQRYATGMKGLHVLPIYGGQDYSVQLKMLSKGVQVVVGTPGRVMDHLRRGTLKLDALRTLVLDEADEMLRMGFIDDVEWILGHTPPKRQLALFSATLPAEVQRIARSHLNDPAVIRLEARTTSAASVRQRVWMVSGTHKLDALTRILEVETFDAMIVFVRTKHATVELAERLCARGFDAAPINGDLQQSQRERLIGNLRAGKLDILVATDVAARGLDVERVSHVVNFDIPHDTESYVHRIGRTGRAGRSGDAILFVAQRERHMLRSIERATGQPIELMDLPTHSAINDVRVSRFFESLDRTLEEEDLTELVALMERYRQEHDADPLRMAAAMAHQGKNGSPLLLKVKPEPARQPAFRERDESSERKKPARRRDPGDDADMELFRIEVGLDHGAMPGNIAGAIINEADVTPAHVGKIRMFADHSTVELPSGIPEPIFEHLKTVWVSGQQLKMSRMGARSEGGAASPQRRPIDRGKSKSKAARIKPGKSDKPGKSGKSGKSGKPGKTSKSDNADKSVRGKSAAPRKPKPILSKRSPS